MEEGSASRWIIEAGHAGTDLTGQTSRRLSITAILYSVGYLTDQIADHLTASFSAGAHSSIFWLSFDDVAALLSVTVSLVVAIAARSRRLSPQSVQDMGLIYLVVAALGIAISEHWEPWIAGYPVRGISWICFWVIVFPLLVPSPLGKWSLAAFCAASMGPLALILTVAFRGNPLPDRRTLLDLFLPNYTAFGLSVLINVMVVRLQREVRRARRLGSYRLVRLLGEGGMGQVWEAEHRMLARPAAIKLIRPDATGSGDGESTRTLLTRFRREADATARLSSPHTIALYDFGVTQDGEFYYVMEKLNGMDLHHLVDRYGPLPDARAVHLLKQVCHSLAEAHAAGLIHRDIKPANIQVCRLGVEYDFVKVLDFGLVKRLAGTTDREATAATEEHVPAGTPAYLAPELVLGTTVVDARADIYSLGCVAYWLLTGRSVFEGSSALHVIMQHVHSTPTPPSVLSLFPVSPALESVILKCLAKEPSRRPQSVTELCETLCSLECEGTWSQRDARDWWLAREDEGDGPGAPPSRSDRQTPSGVPVMGPVAGWQI